MADLPTTQHVVILNLEGDVWVATVPTAPGLGAVGRAEGNSPATALTFLASGWLARERGDDDPPVRSVSPRLKPEALAAIHNAVVPDTEFWRREYERQGQAKKKP